MSLTTSVTDQAKETVENLADDDADSTNSEVRYMAYGARFRTALRAAQRYIAYTSDVGEAFRPVVKPWIVTAAYGVSWLYLAGDVGFETWKSQRKGPTPLEAASFTESQRLALVAAKRGIFQAIASMALPAFTIHTVVKHSGRLFKNTVNPRTKAWGPTLTGLAVVPILPYLYDVPVELATEYIFELFEDKWYHRVAAARRREQENLEKKKEL